MENRTISAETVSDAIDAAKEQLVAVSKTIFDNPELNFKEETAHECLTDFLEGRGFTVRRSYVVGTAFRATYDQIGGTDVTGRTKAPHIAMLCEYDALPDIGHACGHNLIAEIGLGAAISVKTALEKYPSVGAKLTVLGCPAEEGGGGKLKLIEAGAFDGVDVAMMSHPSVADVAMPKLPSITSLTVTYTGVASHGCTAPWVGVNALDAAVLAYNGLSVLRQQARPDWRIGVVISKGGTETYIIPELAELKVSYRAMSTAEEAILGQKVENCLRAASLATGTSMTVTRAEDSYRSMLHNSTAAGVYTEHCRSLGLDVKDRTQGLVFSTDMGDVSNVVPSVHPIYAIGTAAPNHTTDFAQCAGSEAAQPPTLLQAKALALTALDIIQNPELLSEIHQEFLRNNPK